MKVLIVSVFFFYQNWLDPSKEIKKQIRGKNKSKAHTHTHCSNEQTEHFASKTSLSVVCLKLAPGSLVFR